MLTNRIVELASKCRKRIAIGLDPKRPIPIDLATGRGICEVVVVGRQIDGYECIESDTPEEILLEQLLDGSVDGVIRGQLDDTTFLQKLFGHRDLKWTDIHHVSFLKNTSREFWLIPVSNTECWIKKDKVRLLKKMLRLYKALGIEPRIAVISAVREGDLGAQWYFDGIYYDCEEILALFKAEITGDGWVKGFSVETERAINAGANVLLMPNGMVGNQCYRVLVYTGFMECVVNLYLGSGLNIVTNSRNEEKVANYFLWATAIANGLISIDVL